MTEDEAIRHCIKHLRARGYTVSNRPKERKVKLEGPQWPPPVFVAEFADGQVTRMSTFKRPDRALEQAKEAYRVRYDSAITWQRKNRMDRSLVVLKKTPPKIVAWQYEQ